MTQILTLHGTPAGPIQSDAKLEHDSETLTRERARMDNLLKSLWQDFVRDMQHDPQKPLLVKPDFDAIRRHYGERYAEAARVVNASSLPLEVDENALYNIIDSNRELNQREADMNTPLHAVLDLTKYELKLVGQTSLGALYINNAMALAVSESGMVHLWLRHEQESMDQWCQGWLPPQRNAVLMAVDYKMQEVHTLLAGLRVAHMATLTELQMHEARKPVHKPWYLVQLRMHVGQLLGWFLLLISLVSIITIGVIRWLVMI